MSRVDFGNKTGKFAEIVSKEWFFLKLFGAAPGLRNFVDTLLEKHR
jgi:hypothetical protein